MNNNDELLNIMKGSNEKNGTNPRKFSILEVIVILIISITIGLSLGIILTGKNRKLEPIKEEYDKYLENFIESYNYIVDNYYEEVDKEKLINSAIEGMTNSLDDPYSAYISDDEMNNFNISLNGSYQGLGISIVKDPETNYIMIYSIFKDSPADKAGLEVTDLIKTINGEETNEVDLTEFSNRILNGNQTSYKLTIIRNNEEFEVEINKENVVIDSVASQLIEKDNKKIGYIYISIFASNTAEQFKTKLEELENQNIDALIIDVRSNTGGHLISVDAILKTLLTDKQITYRLSENDKIKNYYGQLKKNKDYQIVLLGDSFSASASEVLISSLKENLGAKLIGEKTFGKGTVQELITMQNGVQYKITTQKWLTPNGNWVNDTEGILPDIEVKINEKYYETYDQSDDNQLQEAINYILNN